MPETKDFFTRKISRNEEGFSQLDRLYSPMILQFVLKGHGFIDETELKEAINKASEACVGIRVIRKGKKWVDSHVSPKLIILPELQTEDSVFFNSEVIRKKFHPDISTAEVMLFGKHDPVIIFRIYHGIADAKGALLWIATIFNALNQKPLQPIKMHISERDFIQPLKKHSGFIKANFDFLLTEKYKQTRNYVPYFKRLTLEGNFLALIPKTAAVINSFFQSKKAIYLVPTDIRRHRPDIISISNLTLPLYLETEMHQNWEEIYGNYLSCLKEKRELTSRAADNFPFGMFPPFVQRQMMRATKLIQDRKRKFIISGVLSHVGKFQLSSFSTNRFSAQNFYSLPTQQPLSPFFIHFTETQKNTEILFSSYPEYLDEHQAEYLLQNLKEALLHWNN